MNTKQLERQSVSQVRLFFIRHHLYVQSAIAWTRSFAAFSWIILLSQGNSRCLIPCREHIDSTQVFAYAALTCVATSGTLGSSFGGHAV